MSTIDPSQLTAADMSNPALSPQDLADITAAREDLRPYVATHPALYPALKQWLADQGVVPAQPPAAQADPVEVVAEESTSEQPAAEPEQPVVQAPVDAAPSDEDLEHSINEAARDESIANPVAAQPEQAAPAQGESTASTQGAQFGQPQYGQQAQTGQPQYGQPQYGQPGQQAQPGQSAGQQLGVAAQQLGAAANSAFSQFQNAVVAQTGKVSGRSVRATYSLIGIAAASLFLLISMILPYVDGVWRTYSLLGLESWFPVTFLLLLLINVGLGVAYWLTNQKWAFISVGAGSVLLALMTLIETLYFVSKVGDFDYMLMGFYMFSFFGLCLGAAGVILLLELKQGNVAPLDTTPALLNQMGQQGQQGFQGQQAYPTQQGQFGAQPQQGYSAPQGFQGQQAYPTQQGQFGAQPQQGYPTQQAGQPQYGQQPFGQTAQSQQNQQGQTGEQPQNPYSPQV